MPYFFDIHSHLHFPAYNLDREEVIKRALNSDVWVINIGTNKETSLEAIALANEYSEGIYATVGLHPIHTHEDGGYFDKLETNLLSLETEFDYDYYKKLALDPKVVAIGECGLDYGKNHELGIMNHEKQKEVFKKQIELAIEVGKPLMLHIRNAYDDVLDILNSYFLIHNSRLRGNVHFFAGGIEIAQKFLALGFTLSFTGVVTYPKSKKSDMPDYEEIIKYIPIEMIMAETDAPYVAPVPYRGKRNESLYVREVVTKIAEIKGLSIEKTAQILTANAFKLFNISK